VDCIVSNGFEWSCSESERERDEMRSRVVLFCCALRTVSTFKTALTPIAAMLSLNLLLSLTVEEMTIV
jgi:hypothetical protein